MRSLRWSSALVLLVVSSWSPRALAIEGGVGLGVTRDLPDGGVDTTSLGFGPQLQLFARVPVTQGTWLRVGLDTGAAWGHDRVEWLQSGVAGYYSDDHWTMVTASRLVAGPDLAFRVSEHLRPMWGAEAGLAWVQAWHSFQLEGADFMDPSLNDLDRASNIDPYTSQWAPTAGTHAGLGLVDVLPFAIEFEVGYYVSFLSEATLHKTPEDAHAVRTAFGLNALRLGVSTTVPLGGKAEP